MAEREPNFLSDPADITAQELRTTYAHLQEGVLGANDLKVTVGAGRSVDVAAGTVLVQGDEITAAGQEQGLYLCANDAVKNSNAFTGGGIDPPDANPRVDQIVAQLLDTDYDSSGERAWRLQVVTGTPAAGAQITNPTGANYRAGAAALPGSACRLADVLVATDGSLTVVDRRPWARGAYRRIVRLANASGTDDYTISGTSFSLIDSANLQPRIECTGNPIRIALRGVWRHGTSGQGIIVAPAIDGQVADGYGDVFTHTNAAANQNQPLDVHWDLIPTPGSHRLSFVGRVTGGTGIIFARAQLPLQLVVEELVRPDASND